MRFNKPFSCFFLSTVLLLGSGQAQSQFGYNVWPDCETVTAVMDESVFWTAIPSPVVTTAPQSTQVPQATQVPATTKKPSAAATPDTSQSMGDYTTEFLSMQEQIAWNLLNQDRLNAGLQALPLDAELSRIARLKSRDMHENNYFAHTSPTYGSAANMLKTFGYAFSGVGENIAHHATVDKSQAAFMSSQGHKQNILGSQWSKVGIGVWVDDQGFVYVTQLFVR